MTCFGAKFLCRTTTGLPFRLLHLPEWITCTSVPTTQFLEKSGQQEPIILKLFALTVGYESYCNILLHVCLFSREINSVNVSNHSTIFPIVSRTKGWCKKVFIGLIPGPSVRYSPYALPNLAVALTAPAPPPPPPLPTSTPVHAQNSLPIFYPPQGSKNFDERIVLLKHQ